MLPSRGHTVHVYSVGVVTAPKTPHPAYPHPPHTTPCTNTLPVGPDKPQQQRCSTCSGMRYHLNYQPRQQRRWRETWQVLDYSSISNNACWLRTCSKLPSDDKLINNICVVAWNNFWQSSHEHWSRIPYWVSVTWLQVVLLVLCHWQNDVIRQTGYLQYMAS